MTEPAASAAAPYAVLVIEDDPDDRYLIRQYVLDTFGSALSIDTCGSLREGLQRLGSRKYDAVVTDLSLPDSTRAETLARIKTAAGEAAIIVLTGLGGDDDRLEARRLGAAFFEKNVDSYRDLGLRLRALASRDSLATPDILSLERVLDEAARRGAEAGARAVLHEMGLDDTSAATDLRDLRDLLRAWRDAKQVAWRTLVRWVTTILLAGVVAGAAFWATGRYSGSS